MIKNKKTLYLNRKKTALLVIDMQNDLCHEKGFFSTHNQNIEPIKQIIPQVRKLINNIRKGRVSIVFIKHLLRQDLTDAGLLTKFLPLLKKGGLRKGTWGSEIIEDLKPEPNDFIVEKSRYNAFYNSNLELVLKSLKVDTLIFAGITTEICVESTLREAFSRDFKNILVKDCVNAFDRKRHEATLRVVKYGLGYVVDSNNLILK